MLYTEYLYILYQILYSFTAAATLYHSQTLPPPLSFSAPAYAFHFVLALHIILHIILLSTHPMRQPATPTADWGQSVFK